MASSSPSVLVTRRLPSSVLGILRNACEVDVNGSTDELTPEALCERLPGKQGLLCMFNDPIDAGTLAVGDALKVISTVAVGYDNIDVVAATERGIVVTNTPNILTGATAELTWALILAVTRRVGEGDRIIRRDNWHGWTFDFLLGGELRGKQLGVVGAGAHELDSTRIVDTVVFDKTGTLTSGHPSIVSITSEANDDPLLLSLAAALESRSGHPIARAFQPLITGEAEVSEFANQPGRGITGRVDGTEIRVGKAELFTRVPTQLENPDFDGTTLFIGRGATAEASVSIRDEIRSNSPEAVSLLTDMYLEVVLLSGP